MLKDLLVHLDASEQGLRRFDAAASLARDLDARLTGLYAIPPPSATAFAAGMPAGVAAVGVSDAMLEATMAQPLKERRDEVHGQIHERAEKSGCDFHWCESEGPVVDVIGAYSRCCDLVIVGQEPDAEAIDGHPTPLPSLGGILLETGRPVLVMPEDGTDGVLHGRAMVAWSGTCESTRALHDALPLLRKAESVVVQTVVDDDEDDRKIPAELDITEHLKRHGIEARWVRETADGDVGELLLKRVKQDDCNLLVMGAYGHSRLREYVFGGVTRHVLDHAGVPVLVSH